MTLFCIVFAVKRYVNCYASIKAGFAKYFSKHFFDFRKIDLYPKLPEKSLVLFDCIFSWVVDLQLYQILMKS